MEKELMELFEAAKKAADAALNAGVSSSGPDVSRCVDALRRLQSFPVTYDVLLSTQVGKRLRPLTKHPSEKIQIVASNLLDSWKKVVIEETTRNKKNGSTDNTSSVKTEGVKPDTVKAVKARKTSAVKIEKASTAETVKVEKTGSVSRSEIEKVEKKETNGDSFIDLGETVKVEKKIEEEKQALNVKTRSEAAAITTPKLTKLIKCNDSLRDKFRENLVEALSKVASESDEDIIDEVNACDPIRVAVSVESVMFEKLGHCNRAEKHKYRSIMFNMKDPKNPDLRRRVLLGEVKPERLVTMTPEEMASNERQHQIEQIKEKAMFDCERGGQQAATTDQFKCSKCGQRKCIYHQMQTRSADEPMTTYVTCVNCENHWKFC